MLSQSYDKKHKTSDETHSSETRLHTSTATGTFLKLLTDIKYYFAPDFQKGVKKMRHLDKVQAFFFTVWAVNRPLCVFTWCETACVHFSVEGNVAFLSESANPDFDWWHYSDTCQVSYFIIIIQICTTLFFTFQFIFYSSKQCSWNNPTYW